MSCSTEIYIGFMLLFVAVVIGCNDFEGDTIQAIPELVINNERTDWLFDCEVPVIINQFRLPKILTQRVGFFFTGYHAIGNNLLLVDRYTSNLNCLTKNGEIIWSLLPPTPGLDKYTNIGSVDVNYTLGEIYVEDRSNIKIDVFSFQGKYLRSTSPAITFMDFAVLNSGKYVFDVAQSSQESINEGNPNVMRYLFQEDNRLVLMAPVDERFDFDALPFNGYNRFSRVGSKLLHRMPFEELVYEIENEKANPILRINFKFNAQFHEIAFEKSISNKPDFMYREGIPYPLDVVVNDATGSVFVIYIQGTKSFLTLAVNGDQIINPARHYKIKDVVLPAPRYYDSGRFYLQMYKYHYDFLQERLQSGTFNQEDMSLEFKKLYDQIGDNDDIFIFSLDFAENL